MYNLQFSTFSFVKAVEFRRTRFQGQHVGMQGKGKYKILLEYFFPMNFLHYSISCKDGHR